MSNITITGLVATTPRHLVTREGLPITSFRVASPTSSSLSDSDADGSTNWFTVMSFKGLAINTSMSISKGDRIVVSGHMRIREWDNGNVSGTSTEIEAESIGHDLSYGTTVFTRTTITAHAEPAVEPVVEPVVEETATHSCSCMDCGL